MRVIICDDKQYFQEKYSNYINRIATALKLQITINIFSSGSALLLNIEDWYKCADLILLDIQLGDANGIDIAKEIRKSGFEGAILFLTISPSFVFESFYVNPIHYIVKKENDFNDFKKKMLHVFSKIESERVNKFYYHVGQTQYFALIKNIIFFEVKKRIINIHSINAIGQIDVREFYSTLETVYKETEQYNFIKVHRSYLVNPRHIKSFSKNEVYLTNGHKLSISRTYKEKAYRSFIDFLECE